MASKVWFVTGSSSGLGRAIAQAALNAGDNVVATSRDPRATAALQSAGGDHVLCCALDVTSPKEVQDAVAAAVNRFGRIDVLVNNAGFGLFGAFEEASDADVRRQFEVNVFGLFAVTRAVLPVMRRQRSGHIMNMSSVGGRVAFPALSIYHATKFAVEGMSESLAQEIAPFGIQLTIIEPGGFRTDVFGRSAVFDTPLPDYVHTPAGDFRRLVQSNVGQEPGDPAKAAAVIVRVVNSANPPLRLPIGPEPYQHIRRRFQADLDSMAETEPFAGQTSFASVSPA